MADEETLRILDEYERNMFRNEGGEVRILQEHPDIKFKRFLPLETYGAFDEEANEGEFREKTVSFAYYCLSIHSLRRFVPALLTDPAYYPDERTVCLAFWENFQSPEVFRYYDLFMRSRELKSPLTLKRFLERLPFMAYHQESTFEMFRHLFDVGSPEFLKSENNRLQFDLYNTVLLIPFDDLRRRCVEELLRRGFDPGTPRRKYVENRVRGKTFRGPCDARIKVDDETWAMIDHANRMREIRAMVPLLLPPKPKSQSEHVSMIQQWFKRLRLQSEPQERVQTNGDVLRLVQEMLNGER